MSTDKAPVQPKCTLEPMNLHDQAQAAELLRQRIMCGWDHTQEIIDEFREAMDVKKKALFWIKPTSKPDVRAGHIALDSEAFPPDLDVANPHDKSVLTIASFFILPEHRSGGIGRDAVATLEKWATVEPYGSKNCKAIAITTKTRWYTEDDEGRAEFERISGMAAPPRGGAYEDWYMRMGYAKFKENAPIYPGPDGYRYTGVYLRKQLT